MWKLDSGTMVKEKTKKREVIWCAVSWKHTYRHAHTHTPTSATNGNEKLVVLRKTSICITETIICASLLYACPYRWKSGGIDSPLLQAMHICCTAHNWREKYHRFLFLHFVLWWVCYDMTVHLVLLSPFSHTLFTRLCSFVFIFFCYALLLSGYSCILHFKWDLQTVFQQQPV